MSQDPQQLNDRIRDIQTSIENAYSDLGNLTIEQFQSDGKTQRAVIESLIVIGEAANQVMRLAPVIQTKDPNLWSNLRNAYDMRIILTHHYFRIDTEIVWTTVKESLPLLAQALTVRS